MINAISNILSTHNIYHKREGNKILTRRSKTIIPEFDNNLAYLTGVIVGDGSMVKTKRKRGGNHYVLSIFSSSKKYLIYLSKIFKKYFSCNVRFYKDKRHNVHTLLVQTAPVLFYFMNIGLPVGKPEEESVPKIVKINKTYFKEYIAGLCDTDGHVDKSNKIQLKQKSKNLLCEIEAFLNKQNIKCSYPKVNYTNGKPYYYVRMDCKVPLRLKMPL